MQIVHSEAGFYEPIYEKVLYDLNHLVEQAERAKVEEVIDSLQEVITNACNAQINRDQIWGLKYGWHKLRFKFLNKSYDE